MFFLCNWSDFEGLGDNLPHGVAVALWVEQGVGLITDSCPAASLMCERLPTLTPNLDDTTLPLKHKCL